jgi:hypothetical protein
MKIVLGQTIEIEIARGVFYVKLGKRELCLAKGIGLFVTGKKGTWHIHSSKLA